MTCPEVEVEFIETDDGFGPYGAKSVGESGKALAPAAIANAVFNAIGRRMKELCLRADRIRGRSHEDVCQPAEFARRFSLCARQHGRAVSFAGGGTICSPS